MLHLYDSTVSGNCYKVRLLLAKLGREYTKEEVDVVRREKRLAEMGDKSPILKVPVLRLDDGTHLAESGAILWHLAQGSAFAPGDPLGQARVLQWMFFEQNNVEANIASTLYWHLIREEPEAYPETNALRVEGGNAALDAMERHLQGREWFVGEHESIADIALYGYVHKAAAGPFDLGARPAVRAWLERMQEQPGWVPMSPEAVKA